MNIAYEIAIYLSNAGFGTIGTDIYVGQIPDTKDGLYVLQSGGNMSNYTPVEETVLDIYIKNTSAVTAIMALQKMKRFIHRMHTTEINDAFVYTILALSDIEEISRDAENAKIYKLTIQVTHRDINLIS